MSTPKQFSSYQDVAGALEELLDDLYPWLADRPGYLKLGSHGAVYGQATRDIEGFLRVLWGLGPLLSQSEAQGFQDLLLVGLINGTDPDHPDYWGQTRNYDQRFVEMASLVNTLMVARDKTWDRLTDAQRDHVAAWLSQINAHKIPSNNWRFFRVLINVFLMKMGYAYSQEWLDADLALVETCYVGDGWYFDGREPQRDYYIPWAFHYYGLLYATWMADKDPERSERFKARAREFAVSYQHYFDASGRAVPFGRSLAYRFAQGAFWAALVYADVEALPWGVIKGYYNRHMTEWFQNPILDRDGILTVGYHYENLVMAEGYNAPGSPYWAFKAFLMLAVPKSHPYWQAEEVGMPRDLDQQVLLSEARAMVSHSSDFGHTLLYPYGQGVPNQAHAAAKYAKFAYSTRFGFSVPKSSFEYYESALDSVLAVSEDGYYYRPKAEDMTFEAFEAHLKYTWQPMTGVTIETTIVPIGEYHVRYHKLTTGRALQVYDGGFSNRLEEGTEQEGLSEQLASVSSSVGVSSIENILGFDATEIVRPEPNTNVLFDRTLLPVLSASLEPGEHLLVSLVGGVTQREAEYPHVKCDGAELRISQGNKTLKITT